MFCKKNLMIVEHASEISHTVYMSTYVLINVGIFFVPAITYIVSEKYRTLQLKPALFAIVTTAVLFLIWDEIAIIRGHWMFNESHIIGIKIMNLPIEEIAFFFTVGFSMLFTYSLFSTDEVISHYPYRLIYVFVACMITIAYCVRSYEYTMFVTILFALMLSISLHWFSQIVKSVRYLLYMIIGYGFFIVFNYFLTSIPVVLYGGHTVTGLRFITIPIEDFLYNYVLLTSYVLFYEYAKK